MRRRDSVDSGTRERETRFTIRMTYKLWWRKMMKRLKRKRRNNSMKTSRLMNLFAIVTLASPSHPTSFQTYHRSYHPNSTSVQTWWRLYFGWSSRIQVQSASCFRLWLRWCKWLAAGKIKMHLDSRLLMLLSLLSRYSLSMILMCLSKYTQP